MPQAWQRPAHGVCLVRPVQRVSRRRWRRPRARTLEVLIGPALPRKRLALRRAAAVHVLVQLGHGRVRHLPRLWPRHWCRLGPRHPQRQTHLARWGHQAHTNARLPRVPRRPHAPRRSRRHSARHRLGQPHRRAAPLGARRLAQLDWRLEAPVVRHSPLLRLLGEQSLQNAHSRAALQIPQLHRMPHLPRRPPQGRKPAMALRLQGRCRRCAAPQKTPHAPWCTVVTCPARSLARPVFTRLDAAAHRAPANVFWSVGQHGFSREWGKAR